MVLTLSNACIFDISSKYVRQNKGVQGRPQKRNYVIMSNYSSGSNSAREAKGFG